MADKRFFTNSGPFTLAELASASGAELADKTQENIKIYDIAPLHTAGENDISFLDNSKYAEAFSKTKAGACVVNKKYADRAPQGTAILVSENPYHSYAIITSMFYAPYIPQETMVHPTAVIADSAVIGDKCEIGPNAVIGENCRIGNGTHIYAGVFIDKGVHIGENCSIRANAKISHSTIGNRVIIHQGAAIGQDGFGFATSAQGTHEKVQQLGGVVVGDDVEIGANTTVDRGSGPDTIIGSGTKIDNLVQIGHNAQLGRGCIVVAQVGISGSTKIGDFVAIGGQAGITGHLTIGSGARIAAQSGVMRDVPAGETVSGSPAVPVRQYHKQTVILHKLAKEGTGTDDAA